MMNSNISKWEMGKAITEYYMPYALKTILDRALPDVRDGFKPVHRRIIWKMYQKGMTHDKERDKSATVVGEVLKIHGHGDTAVYDAMCKLTKQQEGQIHPYIDGEGAFGKQYSTDSPSAMRYTFARLNEFTEKEVAGDIKKGVVKMIGEDKEHLQPLVLPTTYPNVLVKQNEGIAVGMSCYFPSFNLAEVCKGTIAYIENPNADLTEYIKAPDFSTGGQILYNSSEMEKIINEGRGKLTIRSRYRYDAVNNCIEIYEIPHNTTANAIIKQVTEMMKNGVKEIKEITDIRDESGFNKTLRKEELMVTIDVKKNTDVDKLMNFLYKKTYLEKSISANMNCLVNYQPKVLGVKGILDNWLAFRRECIITALQYDLTKMKSDLHVKKGLEKVLLDIDKTIEIIRRSKKAEVNNKLREYFQIDEIQAGKIIKMELGNINEEYILEQIKDIKKLEEQVEKLNHKIEDVNEINQDIIDKLQEIIDKYGIPRKTEILYDYQATTIVEDKNEVDNYNVMFFVTEENYIKKIPLTGLRGAGEHRLKDGDTIKKSIQGQNIDDVLVFTNMGNIHRIKASKIDDGKVSNIGTYIPTLIQLRSDEEIVDVIITRYDNPDESIFAFYDNGYVARINVSAYKSNYSILKGNINSKTIAVMNCIEDVNVMLVTSEGKALIFNTRGINAVNSKTAKGVKGIAIKNDAVVVGVIVEPKKKMSIELELENKGSMTLEIADTVYYTGSRANVGVFVYNCRAKKDTIISAKKVKKLKNNEEK